MGCLKSCGVKYSIGNANKCDKIPDFLLNRHFNEISAHFCDAYCFDPRKFLNDYLHLTIICHNFLAIVLSTVPEKLLRFFE